MSRCRIASRLASPALVLLTVTACGNSSGLPAAGIENVVDTISLFALDGTPLPTPAGQAVLLPTGALKLGVGSGIQLQSASFDALTTAPTNTYVDSLPVNLDSGTVVVVHSRAATCSFGAVVFYYGKLQVLAIDTLARRVDLQVLVDQNCGYRSLAPGLPNK
jgi:hypothetical protein